MPANGSAARLDRILRSARVAHDEAALRRVADRLDAGMRERLDALLADAGEGTGFARLAAGRSSSRPARRLSRNRRFAMFGKFLWRTLLVFADIESASAGALYGPPMALGLVFTALRWIAGAFSGD